MVIEALRKLGPCLSTDLAKYLVEKVGLTPVAARQRVSRLPVSVKRLTHLPFARKSKFLYLEEDYPTEYFYSALEKAIHASGGPYSRALAAVEARILVPIAHFSTICGAPVAQKKQIPAETVMKRMLCSGALFTVQAPGIGECITTYNFIILDATSKNNAIAKTRSRLICERVFLDAMRSWIRNLNLASWDKISCRDDITRNQVGAFSWDLTGPSYLNPLTTWTKSGSKSPGFIVCDILLDDEVSKNTVSSFQNKCTTMRQVRNARPVIALFIAHRYSKDALIEIKKDGNIPATPESLFGKDVAEGFKQLTSALESAAKGAIDPTRFDELFKRLGKMEGAVGNMRGALFELLVAEVVRRTSVGSPEIQINKICTGNDGNKAEVDVWAASQNQYIRIIECKGRQPGSHVDDDEIKTWLEKRIIRVRQHINKLIDWKAPRIIFELWITGTITTKMISHIDQVRIDNSAKFDLIINDAENIRKIVNSTNDQSLLKTFDQHFLPST